MNEDLLYNELKILFENCVCLGRDAYGDYIDKCIEAALLKFKMFGGIKMDNSFFKKLEYEEIKGFEDWVENNYVPNDEIKSVWHPVTRMLCELRNAKEAIASNVEIDVNIKEVSNG